ncbi:MAG: substrate-binding domain-containing protein [Methanospirillaceae archaeon]|nr:substrate-binding domain-containing protein [Methanospirillaceae archaeon]
MTGRTLTVLIAIILGVVLISSPVLAAEALPEHSADRLLIGTTTSLDATGLLDVLSEKFEADNGIDVQWVAVGTGQAIEYGRNCDVDIIMVHDRVAEDKFIDEGYGLDRRIFGYNYFLLVGPGSDPAQISGLNATEAFSAINTAGETDESVVFVSRGDNSGTHSREKLLWKGGGYDYAVINASPWYREAGAGMGQTLTMTEELQAYTLCDSSTWGAYESELTLIPLVENDDRFLNIYAVMRINPDLCPDVNAEMAKKWENFMISPEVQDIIGTYGIEEKGKAYFSPALGNEELIGVLVEETTTPVV